MMSTFWYFVECKTKIGSWLVAGPASTAGRNFAKGRVGFWAMQSMIHLDLGRSSWAVQRFLEARSVTSSLFFISIFYDFYISPLNLAYASGSREEAFPFPISSRFCIEFIGSFRLFFHFQEYISWQTYFCQYWMVRLFFQNVLVPEFHSLKRILVEMKDLQRNYLGSLTLSEFPSIFVILCTLAMLKKRSFQHRFPRREDGGGSRVIRADSERGRAFSFPSTLNFSAVDPF